MHANKQFFSGAAISRRYHYLDNPHWAFSICCSAKGKRLSLSEHSNLLWILVRIEVQGGHYESDTVGLPGALIDRVMSVDWQ